MRTKTIIAGIAGLGVVIVALGGAWYLTNERTPDHCQLSGRLIHPHMLTTVRVDGKKLDACCARCALTYERQTEKHVAIISVTDYISGRQIDARKAYFVDGSGVEPCCPAAVRGEDARTPYVRMFDRCSPSLIAFTRQDQARAFIIQHGGVVKRLSGLERQAQPTHRESRHHD